MYSRDTGRGNSREGGGGGRCLCQHVCLVPLPLARARLALHCVLRALRLREGLGEPLLQRGALRGARRKWSDRRRKRIFHVCKILRPFTMRRGGARLARRGLGLRGLERQRLLHIRTRTLCPRSAPLRRVVRLLSRLRPPRRAPVTSRPRRKKPRRKRTGPPRFGFQSAGPQALQKTLCATCSSRSSPAPRSSTAWGGRE